MEQLPKMTANVARMVLRVACSPNKIWWLRRIGEYHYDGEWSFGIKLHTVPNITLLTNCKEPIAEVNDWGANVKALLLSMFDETNYQYHKV